MPRLLTTIIIAVPILAFADDCIRQAYGQYGINSVRYRAGLARGWGYRDGMLAGKADGFRSGLRAAEESSYNQTLSQLCSSDNYHRVPIYSLAVVFAAFSVGFVMQYVILYLLRMGGFLSDIDGLLLPHQATVANLKDLTGHSDRTASISEQADRFRSGPH